jgi:hypothetical protein
MGMMLDMMILSSLMHSFHPSPNIFITNPAGAPLGSAQEAAVDPQRLESDVGSGGGDAVMDEHHGDDQSADDMDHGDGNYDDGGGDHGGIDDGGGFGGDMGGDFGGGDFDV